MEKRWNVLVFLGLILILSISFISAGFFSDFFSNFKASITGQVTGGVYPDFCSNYNPANCASGKCGLFVDYELRCIGNSLDDSACFGDPTDEYKLGEGCCDLGSGGYYTFEGFVNGDTEQVCCNGGWIGGEVCLQETCTDTDGGEDYSVKGTITGDDASGQPMTANDGWITTSFCYH